MARIKTYGIDSDINAADKVVGTDGTPGNDFGKTKNFTIESLQNFIGRTDVVKKTITVTTEQLLAMTLLDDDTYVKLIDVNSELPRDEAVMIFGIFGKVNQGGGQIIRWPSGTTMTITPQNPGGADAAAEWTMDFSSSFIQIEPQSYADRKTHIGAPTAGSWPLDWDVYLKSSNTTLPTTENPIPSIPAGPCEQTMTFVIYYSIIKF
jgi:hypothetical protein